MQALDRYVFRLLLIAFTTVLATLIILNWILQVLRDFELVTNQATTILRFVATTSLLMPTLALVIAPIALVASMAFVLYRLQSDSELIVMAGAGFSPWRMFRPFILGASLVSALVVSLGFYVAPKSLRALRVEFEAARSNLFVSIMHPGRFVTIGGVLTFHLRERRPDGSLENIIVDDRRNPEERVTITAETAQVARTDNRTFLILHDGSLQRLKAKQLDPSIVEFKQYAFDMTDFAAVRAPVFNVTERYFWDIVRPDESDPYYLQNRTRFRIEMHDRILAPVYPILFALIVFAVLGAPKTSRHRRVGEILLAVALVAALRLGLHGLMIASVKTPSLVLGGYVLAALSGGICVWVISRGAGLTAPAWTARFADRTRRGLRSLLPLRRASQA